MFAPERSIYRNQDGFEVAVGKWDGTRCIGMQWPRYPMGRNGQPVWFVVAEEITDVIEEALKRLQTGGDQI